MDPYTVILIGPQGSGKGTQLGLLEEYFKTNDPGRRTEVFQSGSRFREFALGDSYTALHIRDTINTGQLQPLFVSVGLWARDMINSMNPEVHALIDGFPRTLDEAHVLHSALEFFNRDKRLVVVLEAPEEVVRKRMETRAREDDTPESIEKRLKWYREETAPILRYYGENRRYHVHRIDALQSVEAVHAQIIEGLAQL